MKNQRKLQSEVLQNIIQKLQREAKTDTTNTQIDDCSLSCTSTGTSINNDWDNLVLRAKINPNHGLITNYNKILENKVLTGLTFARGRNV